MDDVVDFAENLLRTKPKDLDDRLAKIAPDMLKSLSKNIVINYQNLQEVTRELKSQNSKLRFYAERLEDLILRSVGPKGLSAVKNDK